MKPRTFETRDGRTMRSMNIMVPVPIYELIRDMKYARKTTYSEFIIHAIDCTYHVSEGQPNRQERR